MEIKRPFDSTKKNPSVRGFGDFQHIESMGKVHLSQTPVKAYFFNSVWMRRSTE
jgi:hypothetical protein